MSKVYPVNLKFAGERLGEALLEEVVHLVGGTLGGQPRTEPDLCRNRLDAPAAAEAGRIEQGRA